MNPWIHSFAALAVLGPTLGCAGGQDGDPNDGDGATPPVSPSPTAPTPETTDTATGPTAPTGTTGDTGGTTGLPASAFAEPGPYAVTVGGGAQIPGASCRTSWVSYVPDGAGGDVTVILAHGFSRDQGAVADLAAHVASWGVPVATLDLCHSTPIDNDADADAADMIALADAVGAAQRLYIGHSAGGLRSLLAAERDPAAIAMLGLDLVDAFDIALDAAPNVAVPVNGLVGEPSTCNTDNNGLPVYAAVPDARVVRVIDADHCDFEWPTNALCTLFCDQPGDTFDDDAIRPLIHGMTAAFAAWRAGADPTGRAWWTAGAPEHDAFVAAGALVDLR